MSETPERSEPLAQRESAAFTSEGVTTMSAPLSSLPATPPVEEAPRHERVRDTEACPATTTAYLGFGPGGQTIPCGGAAGHPGAHAYAIAWADENVAADAGACPHGYVLGTVKGGALVCPECARAALARPVSGDTEGLRAAILSNEADAHDPERPVRPEIKTAWIAGVDAALERVQPLLDQAAEDRAAVEAVEALARDEKRTWVAEGSSTVMVRLDDLLAALASTTERSDDEAQR